MSEAVKNIDDFNGFVFKICGIIKELSNTQVDEKMVQEKCNSFFYHLASQKVRNL